jgi:hypothetical protein
MQPEASTQKGSRNFIAMALNKNFEEPDRKKAASNEL